MRKLLAAGDLELVVTDAALDAIASLGYDPIYGARPLKRVIQQKIQNPLATEILRQEIGEGSEVVVDYRDGEFTFEPRPRKSEGATQREPAGVE